jgi:hypothetical protein
VRRASKPRKPVAISKDVLLVTENPPIEVAEAMDNRLIEVVEVTVSPPTEAVEVTESLLTEVVEMMVNHLIEVAVAAKVDHTEVAEVEDLEEVAEANTLEMVPKTPHHHLSLTEKLHIQAMRLQ